MALTPADPVEAMLSAQMIAANAARGYRPGVGAAIGLGLGAAALGAAVAAPYYGYGYGGRSLLAPAAGGGGRVGLRPMDLCPRVLQ